MESLKNTLMHTINKYHNLFYFRENKQHRLIPASEMY